MMYKVNSAVRLAAVSYQVSEGAMSVKDDMKQAMQHMQNKRYEDAIAGGIVLSGVVLGMLAIVFAGGLP